MIEHTMQITKKKKKREYFLVSLKGKKIIQLMFDQDKEVTNICG